MTASMVNTAGESEREKRSRRWNATEALGLAGAAFLLAWPVAYGCGVLGGRRWMSEAASAGLYLILFFGLCVSPFLHGDTAESWDLGNPRRLWWRLRAGPRLRRGFLTLIVAGIVIGLVWLMLAHWPAVVRKLNLPSAARAMPGSVFGCLLIVGAGGALALFLATWAIRYDNFAPAFMAALKVSLALVAFAAIAGFAFRGWAVWDRFKPAQYALDVVGYFFWGYFQQLFFCAWFGTRLRKAFGPSVAGRLAMSEGRRWGVVTMAGLVAALVLGAGGWLALRAARGGTASSVKVLVWFTVLAFAIGAVWGWFYCKDRKRLLVATLSASFFALIHIDSYGLVLATWLMGVFLAWMFMEDRTRNIAALGFIHGFLGTTFNLMLGKADAGVFRVSYRVGPWNVEHPGPETLVVPIVCLVLYVALAAWCWRRLANTPPAPACSLAEQNAPRT